MKLYLSSYHIGSDPMLFKNLFTYNRHVAIIPNALDFSHDVERKKKGLLTEISDLTSLGLISEEFDLRNYFTKPNTLKLALEKYGLVWVIGGNTFILRRAMKQSGFDNALKEYLQRDEKKTFIYSGYSAGVCVLSPSLKGLELVDYPEIIPEGYDSEIIWDGLGLIKYAVAPHYRSSHPESANMENVVKYYKDNKIPYKTLKDGEVIIKEL